MRILLSSIAVAAALIVTTAPATAANLVTNGSFETTTFKTSSEIGGVFGNGGITGWSNSGGGYNLLYIGGTQTAVSAANRFNDPKTYFYANVTTSPDGGNFVALDGDQSFRGAFTQLLTGLTNGQVYKVSFDWGATQLINRDAPTTEQLQVGFGSATQSTAILSEPAAGFSGWKSQSFLFTATGSSQLLSFLSVGGPAGQPPIAVLDGVSVTAVPEPAVWALMIGGFTLVGFAARRRRDTTVVA